MMAYPAQLVVSAINHVLINEQWAREKLLAFVGQTARIEAQALNISLVITADGLFESDSTSIQQPTVIIYLPDNTLVKMISGESSAVFAAARISGSAEFAEALAFVFRNIKWDAEADLAGLIGDIPANRAMSALTSFIEWQKSATTNVAQNVKEYLTEESAQLTPQREIEAFGQAVNILRDDLERLEKRISRL